jgi:hypothetical protein
MSAARRALVVAALAAASLAAAPAAEAHHVTASVTATLTLGKSVKSCGPSGLCSRPRRATIAWNASCGPAAPPDALKSVDVTIYGIAPSGKRFGYDGETLEEEPPLNGSMTMTAGPGVRFTGEVVVTCSAEVVNSDGHLEDHEARATAGTGQFYVPPQLVGFRTTRAGFCGVNVPRSKVDKWLQAGQYAQIEYFAHYSVSSLIRRGIPEMRQIKLFARGAGVRVKRSPDRGMLNQLGAVGTWLTPRRGGTLKIWATIGGNKTNTLRVRVLPKRC